MTLWLGACAQIPSVSERVDFANSVATQKGWKSEEIKSEVFTLKVYLPIEPKKTEVLNIYIEGDGLAWINSSTPSFDPTPANPLALKLAMLDTGASVYLARPCQFVGVEQQRGCTKKYWTSHRFSPEVIEASNNAVNQLKVRFSVNKVRLIGYSGGGAVAALIAARRHDVAQLVTVAGNLDHAIWTKQQRISSLSGSLNSADEWKSLQGIPQHHYVGGKDTVIDESIAQAYVARYPVNKKPNFTIIPNFDHHCCWESIWPNIVESKFGDFSASKNSENF
ncbi:MAG: hypothetical protein Q7T88_11765 [Methylotenera sp.]|nr:hypothetical protein [Methylotenera sp.]